MKQHRQILNGQELNLLNLENIALPEFLIVAVLSFLLVTNLIAFIVFAGNKKRSELGGWRVPEKHILTWAILGGSPAIYFSRKMLRHKTYKQPFNNILKIVIFVQLLALVATVFLVF